MKEIARRPGLIPARIDASNRHVQWIDLGQYHCYEGFFSDSLGLLAALAARLGVSEAATFLSPLRSITSEIIQSMDCVPPSAFIFQSGRCGSTLLLKVLARSRAHIAFGEAPAHNQIWNALANDDCDSGTELYRRLLTAMGRRRLSSYRAHVVKFTSFNILKFNVVRAAFPDTPALFLFREPVRMLDSYYRDVPSWLGRDVGMGRIWNSSEAAAADFFEAALNVRDANFRCLEYSDLTPSRLPAILAYFRLKVLPDELTLMTSEFVRDAKSTVPRAYLARQRTSERTYTNILQLKRFYTQLQNKARSDWQPNL